MGKVMSQHIDPGHENSRRPLRIIGPVVAGIGLVFTIIGIGSFFAAFGTGQMPGYFWCAFVGLPLLAVGLGICKFAFLGAVTRYVANEVAPVGKDVVNYMAAGTKDAVRDVAAAVGEGFRAGNAAAETKTTLHCPKCRAANDSEAHFCKACGAALRARPCENCGHVNATDARFCVSCGKAMA